MENKENKTNTEEKNSKMEDSPFFVEESITNITQHSERGYSKSELNRIKVFKYIENNQPITAYAIHKKLEMSYNTVSYIVRDLIFAGVVSDKMVINENNVATKILTIPKEKEEEINGNF